MSGGSARFMVTSALAFAAMSVLVKQLGGRIPTQEIVSVRAALTLVASYWMLRRQSITPLLGHNRPLLVLRGLFGFCALTCGYYAMTHLPLAEATVLQYLHPPVTALLAAAVLREPLRKAVFGSMALCGAGLLLVARPAWLLGSSAQSLPTLPLLAGIAGALVSSCAYVTVRKLGRTEHAHVIVFYFPFVALPASLPSLWSHAVWPTGFEWLLLLGVGVFTQIGQISVTRGLQQDEAGRAAAYTYLQVLFAAALGALLFQEIPPGTTLLGAALILLGALWNARPALARA
jgi:drug/metabolite transporter (DMT)-like permease